MKLGFTLSELLITLAILGIISVFTVPKLLTASETSEKNTILKDSISTVQAVIRDGVNNNAWQYNGEPNTRNVNYLNQFMPHVNQDNQTANDCYVGNPPGTMSWQPCFILPSGAFVLMHVTTSTSPGLIIWIDYNGIKPPNEMGAYDLESDIIRVTANLSNQAITGTSTVPNILRPGEIRPHGWSLPLYQTVFSH